MLNGPTLYRVAASFALALVLCTGAGTLGHAQEFVYRGGVANGPTVEEYLEQTGPDATFIEHGKLTIDGKRVNCGTRPTVLNPSFDSWGGAFPGFLILNTKKISGLNTQVKLYIYSHECGHQFVGADEVKADLFAIRRGVKWGWLDAQGLEDICAFISQLKGDSVHPPGPTRCQLMRNRYRELIEGGGQRASSTPPSRVQTLGPSF
jgi:hypothetical protein